MEARILIWLYLKIALWVTKRKFDLDLCDDLQRYDLKLKKKKKKIKNSNGNNCYIIAPCTVYCAAHPAMCLLRVPNLAPQALSINIETRVNLSARNPTWHGRSQDGGDFCGKSATIISTSDDKSQDSTACDYGCSESRFDEEKVCANFRAGPMSHGTKWETA